LTSAREIVRITGGMSKDQFLADTTVQYAVPYLFAVLGESVTRLSTEFRAQHPDIPWKWIVGMRHVLVHGCDQVNLQRVWATIASELPGFIAAVEHLDSSSPE
jgi:uncharacterized protein with HEPN domain